MLRRCVNGAGCEEIASHASVRAACLTSEILRKLDNKPACARAMLLSRKQWALLSLLSPFTYWSPMINCLLLLRFTMQRPLHYGPSSCSGHEYTDDDADDDDP